MREIERIEQLEAENKRLTEQYDELILDLANSEYISNSDYKDKVDRYEKALEKMSTLGSHGGCWCNSLRNIARNTLEEIKKAGE